MFAILLVTVPIAVFVVAVALLLKTFGDDGAVEGGIVLAALSVLGIVLSPIKHRLQKHV